MIRLHLRRLLPPVPAERGGTSGATAHPRSGATHSRSDATHSRSARMPSRVATWSLVLVNAALTAQGVWLVLAPILRAPAQQITGLSWRRQLLVEKLLDLRETTLTVVALWGAAQLLLALVLWVVLVRYRMLVPLMLAVAAVAQGLQLVMSQDQPLLARLLPLDGVAAWVLLALTLAALGVSLLGGDAAGDSSPVLDSGHG
jgi:hypothetical protein